MHKYRNLIKKYINYSQTNNNNNINMAIFDQTKSIDPFNGINDLLLEILYNESLNTYSINLATLTTCINLCIQECS